MEYERSWTLSIISTGIHVGVNRETEFTRARLYDTLLSDTSSPTRANRQFIYSNEEQSTWKSRLRDLSASRVAYNFTERVWWSPVDFNEHGRSFICPFALVLTDRHRRREVAFAFAFPNTNRENFTRIVPTRHRPIRPVSVVGKPPT